MLISAFASPHHQIFEQGRVSSVSFETSFGQLWVWNFHDFGISSENSSLAMESFRDQIRMTTLDPLRKIMVVAGDFNRSKNGLRFYLDPLDQASFAARPSLHVQNLSSQARSWDSMLAQLVEIESHDHTHYSSEGNFENAIDRIFWSVPAWASRLMNINKSTFLPAHSMHMRGLSDHSPIGFSVSPLSSTPPSVRRIPPFVTRHPYFKRILLQFEKDHSVSFDSLMRAAHANPFGALSRYNHVVRAAASCTRNYILRHGQSMDANDCLFATMSRAHFHNDPVLANFLIKSYSEASKHLQIKVVDGRSRVVLANPSDFSCQVSQHRHASISSEIAHSENSVQKAKHQTAAMRAKNKISFLAGVIQRWVPISRFLTLSAILGDQDGQVESSPLPSYILWRNFGLLCLMAVARPSIPIVPPKSLIRSVTNLGTLVGTSCLGFMISARLSTLAGIVPQVVMGSHILVVKWPTCTRVFTQCSSILASR